MTRVLITGASGFVGSHLMDALSAPEFRGYTIAGTSKEAMPDHTHGPFKVLDVIDEGAVADMVKAFGPTHVIHLAGVAAPAAASANVVEAWRLNVFGSLNVARAILRHAPACWMIWVGSGLVYGRSSDSGRAMDETTLLAPTNDYAVTKAAADLALGALAADGLRVLRLRPFNHTGPGQSPDFVVPALADQIARIEAGLSPRVLKTGNLNAARDFLDVRDVVRAYAAAVRASDRLVAGQVLNIASGIPRRIGDILERLLAMARIEIAVEQDPARLRNNDLSIYTGNANAAKAALDWQPAIDFETTLADVLDDCRRRHRAL